MCDDIRRHILDDDGSTANHRMRTNTDKLVIPGMTAKDGPITNLAVAGQLSIAGQNGLVADLAIVRDMYITHNPVIGADGGHTPILRCANMKTHKLADRIAVTDFQTRGFTVVLLVLGNASQRRIMMNLVVAANAGVTFDYTVRANTGAIANVDMLTNDRKGTH